MRTIYMQITFLYLLPYYTIIFQCQIVNLVRLPLLENVSLSLEAVVFTENVLRAQISLCKCKCANKLFIKLILSMICFFSVFIFCWHLCYVLSSNLFEYSHLINALFFTIFLFHFFVFTCELFSEKLQVMSYYLCIFSF